MDFEIWKQRREELMREAQQNRLAKALRESLKRRGPRRASPLVWELKRITGRLLKLLRSLKRVGQERTMAQQHPSKEGPDMAEGTGDTRASSITGKCRRAGRRPS